MGEAFPPKEHMLCKKKKKSATLQCTGWTHRVIKHLAHFPVAKEGGSHQQQPNITLFHLTAILMKLLDWAEHQVNWVRKLFRSYWFSKLCFSSTVSLLCGLTMNTVWGSLQLKAAALEERSPEVISIISQIGDSLLLRAQSHNLSHSAVAVKLCRLHFFIIGFYPSNCCSLLLWHR